MLKASRGSVGVAVPRSSPSPRQPPWRLRASPSGASASRERPRVAFLSFAVANSYDAPMLKAARDVAKKNNATVTVFDAANDPKKQFAQFQTIASSRQYDAILVQPIFGPAADPARQAGDQERDQGRQRRPDSRDEPRDGEAAGRRHVGQRRLHPDGHRTQAGSARRRGVPGEQPQPVQRRLPLLGEGLLARHGDSEGLRRRDQGRAARSRSWPRARPSTSTRSR